MSPGTNITGYQFRLGDLATVYDAFRNESLGVGWPPTINPETGELVVRGNVYNFTPPIIAGLSTPEQLGELLECNKSDFTASTNEDDDRTVVDSPGDVDPPVKILTGSFLPNGTYRDLRVQDGTTLHLGAGVYTFRRFNTGRNTNIYTVPGTIIQITNDTDPNTLDFNFGVGFFFGSEDPSIESVSCICYLGDDMNFASGTGNGEFWGVIKAPYADLSLGKTNTLNGRFYANNINSDFNDNVTAKDCTLISDTTTLTGAKTATGHYGTTYEWTIEKTVNPENWTLFQGDSGTSQYTITVTKSAGITTSAHVEGNITVTNTGDIPTEGLAILDEIYNGTTLIGSATVDVSAKPVLAPGESYDYHYRVDFDDLDEANLSTTYTNNATITINNGDPVVVTETFTLTEVTENDATIHVDDSNIPDGQPGSHTNPWEFTDSGSVTYDTTFSCDQDVGVHLNTAMIQETGQSDMASVNVMCYAPEVTKNATTSFNRTYTWTINKTVNSTSLILYPGDPDSADVEYNVTVNATYLDSDWKVEGNITIHNPATIDANITSISDIVSPDIDATITDAPSFPVIIPAGGHLIVNYTADLPNATFQINTANATLQNYAYHYEDDPVESGTTDFTGSAAVDFTGATIEEIDESIDVNDTLAGSLGTVTYGVDTLPNTSIYIRTISYGEPGEYTVENCASFVTNDNEDTGEDCAKVTVTVPLKFFAEAGSLSNDYTVELNSLISSDVFGLYSGPQVWWKVTYYVNNTYGDRYYFTLWDKWGGNLLALASEPTAFDTTTNNLTLADASYFIINYTGYDEYIGSGRILSPSIGSANITLHTGDQQQGTNPGGGKGPTKKDGKSYDADTEWTIGWLHPGDVATLTIYVAPGMNPAGKLEFTSEECKYINTGPVLRAWDPADPLDLKKRDFEFADETIKNTLEVCASI
jgi:hypothetical protein